MDFFEGLDFASDEANLDDLYDKEVLNTFENTTSSQDTGNYDATFYTEPTPEFFDTNRSIYSSFFLNDDQNQYKNLSPAAVQKPTKLSKEKTVELKKALLDLVKNALKNPNQAAELFDSVSTTSSSHKWNISANTTKSLGEYILYYEIININM